MAAAPGKQNASCWRLALPFFCLLLPLQWQGAVGVHMSLLEAAGAPTLFLRGSGLLERAGDLAPGNYSSWLGVAEMLLFPKLHFMYEMKGEVPTLLHKARMVFKEEIDPGADPAAPAEAVQSNNRQLYFRPVSMTLYAVMFLTIVGLMVHMSLSIARNADELSGNFQVSLATQTLTVASRVTAFVPMLCMLFVSCRMYVLAQTDGLGEPQPWVKASMLTATLGMLVQLVVVVLLPGFARGPKEATYDMLAGQAGHMQVEEVSAVTISPRQQAPQAPMALAEPEVEPGDDEEEEGKDGLHIATGDVTDVHPAVHRVRFRDDTWAVRSAFLGLQVFSMLLLYGGILGVLFGMAAYSHTRTVSPAIICTAILAKVYFLVHLKLWVGRYFHEEGLLEHIGLGVSTQARKAPMYCMLFLWMRMRAIELDPPAGMPSASMSACFYLATAAFIGELVFTGTVVALGGKAINYYGMRFYQGDVKWPEVGQACCALVSYTSLIILTLGAVNMLDAGTGAPAPVSTTGKCTLVLAGAYFAVALGQTCLMLAEALLGKEFALRVAMFHDTLVAAGVSLSLAPAVCILFTATRMRALQITQNQGEPPGWAQDCIMMCTFAICLQSICCLVMPIFIGSATNIDEDGNPDYDLRPMIGAYAVTMVKYVALMMLYGGVLSVCAAVLVMTPETANSENRILTSSKALLRALGITSGIFFISLLLSSAKVVGLAVKFAIEACDTALLGVKITVRHCALSVFKGYVKINDLKIQQPPVGNWEDDCIAKVKLALVKINLWRMLTSLGGEVEIENVGLDGLHVNFEKPNAHMSEKNSNMEYILNHVNESLQRTMGMDLDTMSAMASTRSPRDVVKDGKPIAQQPDASTDSPPQIILHKIKIKDIKVGCRVKEVPVISTFSFHPTLPSLEFNDVQKEVCGGRDVMEPEKLVALIVKAICRKICDHIVKQIPRQIAEATKEKAKATGSRIMGSIKSLVTSH